MRLRRLPTVSFLIGALLGCLLSAYVYQSSCTDKAAAVHQSSARAHTSIHKSDVRVMAAVLMPQRFLNTTARAMMETWGAEMGTLSFLVAGDSTPTDTLQPLPVTVLHDVPDFESYANSQRQTFAALTYIHDTYLEQYDWYVLADNRTYVAVRELEKLLEASDPHAAIYWGRKEELDQGANQHLCVASSGVIMSGAALRAVVPHLRECARQLAGEPGGKHERGDWGLGFCFSRVVGVPCTTPFELSHHDTLEDLLPPDGSSRPRLKVEGVVTFVATTTEAHYVLHHLVKQRQLEALRDEVTSLEAEVLRAHTKVSSLFPEVPLQGPTRGPHEVSLQGPTRGPPAMVIQEQSLPTPTYDTPTSQPPLLEGSSTQIQQGSEAALLPQSRFDINAWTVIVGPYMYSDQRTDPLLRVPKELEYEVQQFVAKAIDMVNAEEKASYTLREVNNVFLRYSPLYGRQCIMDLTLLDGAGGVLKKRMNLASLPQTVPVQVVERPNYKQTVHVIVPLNNVGERFEAFFKDFQHDFLRRRMGVRLMLVVYGEEDFNRITSIVTGDRHWPPSRLLLVKGEGEFARGRALDLGLSHLDNDDLAFFCDTDMMMTRDFMDRCRLNPVQGRRVYYPVFFSFYNMDYAYLWEERPERPVVSRRNGHWVPYSYGMVCMYKSDYITTGGFNLSIMGWGGEDTDFFSKVLEAKLEVLKAPDPGLTHRWHPKHCSTTLTPGQYSDCLGTRDEVLADKKQLAAYAMYLEEHLGITPAALMANVSAVHP